MVTAALQQVLGYECTENIEWVGLRLRHGFSRCFNGRAAIVSGRQGRRRES